MRKSKLVTWNKILLAYLSITLCPYERWHSRDGIKIPLIYQWEIVNSVKRWQNTITTIFQIFQESEKTFFRFFKFLFYFSNFNYFNHIHDSWNIGRYGIYACFAVFKYLLLWTEVEILTLAFFDIFWICRFVAMWKAKTS